MIQVSVKKTLLLHHPWPCNEAAETAPQPVIWCSESLHSQGYNTNTNTSVLREAMLLFLKHVKRIDLFSDIYVLCIV